MNFLEEAAKTRVFEKEHKEEVEAWALKVKVAYSRGIDDHELTTLLKECAQRPFHERWVLLRQAAAAEAAPKQLDRDAKWHAAFHPLHREMLIVLNNFIEGRSFEDSLGRKS